MSTANELLRAAPAASPEPALDPTTLQRYRSIVENTHEGIWQIDAEARTTFVNSRMALMLGYQAAEMIGRHLFDFMDDEGRALAELNLERRRQGIAEQHDFKFQHADGHAVWALLETSPITEDGRYVGALAMVSDITARKRMELELAEARADLERRIDERAGHLRAITESAVDGIVTIDEGGSILAFNRSAERVFGVSASATIGRPIDDLIPDGFRLPTEPGSMSPALGGGAAIGRLQEVTARRGDGREVPIELSLATWSSGRDHFFTAIVRDISERRLVEDSLRRSEASFRELIEQAPDPILVHRFGPIVYANQAAQGLLGHDRVALYGRDSLALVHPDDRAAASARVERLRSEGTTPPPAEVRFVRPDGRVVATELTSIRVSFEGAPASLVMLRELGPRRAAEQGARARAQLAAIAEVSADAMTATDLDGIVTAWNQAAERMTGYPRDEVVGRPIDELIRKAAIPELLELAETVRRERTTLTRELVGRRKDGRSIELEMTLTPMLDPRGELVGIARITRDLTVPRATQRRLEASLREKEVLLREVHHRVKNNLQVISSLLNLQARGQRDPAVREKFEETCARVMSIGLVHELLYQASDLARIPLARYVDELVAGILQTHGDVTARVRRVLEIEALELAVDLAIPCGLVINELVTNAVKHAFPAGRTGTIRIACRRGEAARYHLTVVDDGVGLPAAIDPAQTGTLGLVLVKRLVSQLGGTLALHRDGGTRIEIEFPEGHLA